MNEKPILFKADMVRAILDGRKTQTRRILKVQPDEYAVMAGPGTCELVHDSSEEMFNSEQLACPYGHPCDRLWVRETWRHLDGGAVYDAAGGIVDSFEPETIYRASKPNSYGPWRPSIHMPRWASRIQLEITGIRVERLQDISEEDAIAEGIEVDECGHAIRKDDQVAWGSAKGAYAELWESINGPGSWDVNPWVWVIEFRRIKP